MFDSDVFRDIFMANYLKQKRVSACELHELWSLFLVEVKTIPPFSSQTDNKTIAAGLLPPLPTLSRLG